MLTRQAHTRRLERTFVNRFKDFRVDVNQVFALSIRSCLRPNLFFGRLTDGPLLSIDALRDSMYAPACTFLLVIGQYEPCYSGTCKETIRCTEIERPCYRKDQSISARSSSSRQSGSKGASEFAGVHFDVTPMPRLPGFSSWKNRPTNLRGGTRIPCEIRLTLVTLDSARPFFEPCFVVLVNPQGCGVKFGRPLEIGTRVRLEGLPAKRSVIARVVNCISLGEYEKFWLLGLALDEPSNVWGIEKPPEDWAR